jgi:hypothetical protein
VSRSIALLALCVAVLRFQPLMFLKGHRTVIEGIASALKRMKF